VARRATAEWSPWALSTGLHGLLLALLAGGVVLTRVQPPADTALAIEAVVVDAATLAALQRSIAPLPRPATPQPAPQPTPQPTPQPMPPQSAPSPEPTPVREVDAKPKPQPTPSKPSASTTSAEPVKRVEPVKPPPQPSVPAVDAARAAAEAELQAALAEEERVVALRASGLAAQWSAAIRARIERAWIRPDSARPGLDCTVAVTQAPGGTVLRVAVRDCNGDEAVRQSIEDAVLRASPLPAPPDPALFERELILRFRPDV
jgi:colicin import membrane protein